MVELNEAAKREFTYGVAYEADDEEELEPQLLNEDV